MFDIQPVSPAETRPLRQRVLRPHLTVEGQTQPGEDLPDAAAFGALLEREIVGTAVVFPEPRPNSDARHPWRLIAMAVDPARHRMGIGTQLIDACVDLVCRRGGDELWCHARTTVIPFYEAVGFATTGPEWLDPNTGPHFVMWRPL